MTEQWRPIPGHDGYEASDLGRVKSLRSGTPRILRPARNPQGYMRLSLAGAGRSVHQLVMLAFVGPCPEGMQIRHLDGNPGNNALSNLTYGTQAENNLDTIRHGRHRNLAKTHCPEGHPYDEVNTRIDVAGWRRCRACRRKQHRELNDLRREQRAAQRMALSATDPGSTR